MAKDSWLTVSPMSGKGNATISNSAPNFKGRIQRSTVVTGAATGISGNKTYTVIQKGMGETIVIPTRSYSVNNGETTLTISGSSNSPKLTFATVGTSQIPLDLPTTYTADGKTQANGAAIVGDPGASYLYSFSATIRVPSNNVGQRVSTVRVSGQDPNVWIDIVITQATATFTVAYRAGNYIPSVQPTTQTVNYGGTAASVATVQAEDTNYRYEFDGWYEGSNKVSSSPSLSVANITSARTFEARANRISKAVTITVALDASSAGRGSVSGGGSYNIGASCTVQCVMNNASDVFDGWYEGNMKVSSSQNYTFTVSAARSLRAKILYLDVTPTSLDFGAGGGSETLTVSTNVDSWTVS